MRHKKTSVLILVFCVIALSLSACGRKNPPENPDDKDPAYPRTYPAPQPVPLVK